jgi:cobalt/nickel transport system permease protein
MHIPDAVLTPPVWVPLAAVSAAAVGLASAKARQQLEERQIPVAGVLGAFIFAAQMVNFPIALGTSGHLVGATLLTVLVGPWLAILVMSAVLVVQCFLFNDGGVTALGANIFNMAVVATVTTTLVLRFSSRLFGDRKGRLVAGALGGWLAVFLGAIACTLELVASGRFPLWKSLVAMGGFHAVIGLAEGAITVAALSYILGVRPDVVHAFQARE